MFGWLFWLVVVAVLCAAGFFAYRVWQRRSSQHSRYEGVRAALEQHHETILVCVRCVGDGPAVVRCLGNAVQKAQSPLRLRFAVAQEPGPEDVYRLIIQKFNQPEIGSNHVYGDKVRTINILDPDGFQHAFASWQQLYADERYVLVIDAGVDLVKNWDVQLCEALEDVPRSAVLTAPGPSQFPCVVSAPPHQRSWPIIAGRPFSLAPEEPVAALAASHVFTAFHGSHFALIPPPQQHVPLYVTDTAWSDHLFSAGTRFLTVPGDLFRAFPGYSDEHLHTQRPTHWSKRLALTPAYAKFAGIRPVQLPVKEGSKKLPKTLFQLRPRARVGLTSAAVLTNEALEKYGTRREVERQVMLASRAPQPVP